MCVRVRVPRGAVRAVARVVGDRAVVSVAVKRRVGGRRRVWAAHLVDLGQVPGHTRSSIVNSMGTGIHVPAKHQRARDRVISKLSTSER